MSGGSDVGLAVAFIAGMVSFMSPCVAPLIPGYLAMLSGATLADPQPVSGPDWRMLRTSLCFVLGFALVFVALGASSAAFGGLLGDNRRVMTRLSGVMMIAMGLLMLGVLRLPWLLRERRWHPRPRNVRPSETLLLGMAFGLGWTPCFGPILAVILAYTSTADTVREGTVLLAAYALGLGIPFLLIGAGIGWFQTLARRLRRRSGWMTSMSGVVMLVLGGLFITDRFFYITIMTQRFYYTTFGG